MRDAGPTRAALLEMQEERRALHDGHVFLDEKCLLLAGEMLRQLQRHAELDAALQRAHAAAVGALRAALGRHGLDGLQVQPALDAPDAQLVVDFAGGRTGFGVASFPMWDSFDRVPSFIKLDEYDTPGFADKVTLEAVLVREYPDYF